MYSGSAKETFNTRGGYFALPILSGVAYAGISKFRDEIIARIGYNFSPDLCTIENPHKLGFPDLMQDLCLCTTRMTEMRTIEMFAEGAVLIKIGGELTFTAERTNSGNAPGSGR